MRPQENGTVGRGRGAARRLLEAAGRAWGAVGRGGAARSERGTVLLLVIGVLAMMSIVALVYASIGQADRRSASSLAREARMEDHASAIGDYIAGVISADLFNVFVVEDPVTGNQRRFRDTIDYPSTDPFVESNPSGGAEPFTPVGGNGFNPWLASTEPSSINPVGRTPSIASLPPPDDYLTLTDWQHISNLSPDGRFVNLAALRNNFGAEPGIGVDSSNRPRMSELLTLFGPDGQAWPPASARLPSNEPLNVALRNRPHTWTANQQWMHRPAIDLDQQNGAPGPGSPVYVPNQYADADGDGMIDSRWFELVGQVPGPGQRLLPAVRISGPARYFVAARVIDLSGLVNVNTASDFARRPEGNFPVGSTPAEIDLRRLLRMQDFYDLYGFAYDDYKEPLGRGMLNAYLGAYEETTAANIGEGAYRALRRARQDGRVPPDELINDGPWTAPFRSNYYRSFGYEPTGVSAGGTQGQRFIARPFGIADELELRKFHGANDDSTLSRFEATLAGRVESGPTEVYCPVRSNRPLLAERGLRGNRWPNWNDQATPSSPASTPNGLADDQALLQSATDIRRLMTFFSGSRPLRPVEVVTGVNEDQIQAADVRMDIIGPLEEAARGHQVPLATVQQIFGTYATSLMPHVAGNAAQRREFWDPGDSEYKKRLPMTFGARGPEMALQLAAHLTANLIDKHDRSQLAGGETPTALSIKLRSNVPVVQPEGHTLLDLDAINVGGAGAVPRLDPRAAPPPDVPTELRVYGIEPQPFITEATVFSMFTDRPTTHQNGDEEWDESGDPPIITPRPVTIDFKVSGDNYDCIMQVFAVQVYNPFDEPVNLINYYFQFGDTRLEFPNDPQLEVTLAPRESRVVFATNPGRGEIQARRWAPLAPNGTSLNEWLVRQLGIEQLAPDSFPGYELVRYKREGDQAAEDGDFEDFLKNGFPPENRVVLMWRRFGNEASREDDILADRLHCPNAGAGERPTWDRRFTLQGDTITGTLAWPEDASDPGDNTGFTITLFGTVRRPGNPSAPLGAIPMFCIERPRDHGGSLNTARTEGLPLAQIAGGQNFDRADFTRAGGFETFMGAISHQAMYSIEGVGLDKNPLQNSSDPPVPSTEHLLDLPYSEVYPEIQLSNGQMRIQLTPTDIRYNMRTGDVLLPLAVGPSRKVYGALPLDVANDWTTLAEWLAIGTGYGGNPVDPLDPLYNIALEALDRGHLRLDAAAPFYKDSPRATFQQPLEFIPGEDVPVWPGVPLSQHLLTQFRTRNLEFTRPIGNERRLVPGVININTAPLAVLRLLPMFTPERDLAGGDAGWMMSAPPDTTQPAWTAGGPADLYNLNESYDVAAMVKAYRDKSFVQTRPATIGDYGTVAELDFSDDPSQTHPDGRYTRTLIEGLREQGGFAGVGELLSVMKRGRNAATEPPTFNHADADLANSIVRFGHAASTTTTSETTAAILGIDSVSYLDPEDGVRKPDRIINDYDEQLTIVNAVLNMVSTRSDVFCVWFVVHGYLPSDVEGLATDEPMVPSIAKRYVMIVDRSNVTRRGERPKILLFQEVPM